MTTISEFIILFISTCGRSPPCTPFLRIHVCTCSSRSGSIPPQFLRSSNFYLKRTPSFESILCQPHRIPFHGHSPCSSHGPSHTCSSGIGSRSPSRCRRCPRRRRLRNLRVRRNHRPGMLNRHHFNFYKLRERRSDLSPECRV